MCQLVTSVKKEQAIIKSLELLRENVRTEKAVSDLSTFELNTDNGMTLACKAW